MSNTTAPLYYIYPNQTGPQPAYVELDPETGVVSSDYNSEIGNAVPVGVWHGLIRRYSVSPCVLGGELDECLASSEFLSLAERVSAGYSAQWDGSNYVGRLTDDARAAEDEIEALLAGLSEAEVWDAAEWIGCGFDADDVIRLGIQGYAEEAEAALGQNQVFADDCADAIAEELAARVEHHIRVSADDSSTMRRAAELLANYSPQYRTLLADYRAEFGGE